MIKQIILVFTINLLGAMLPGPDMAIVTANAMRHRTWGGIATACGIGCALIIHCSYASLGLASIIAHSPTLFELIKLIGCGYLLYLGTKLCLQKPLVTEPDAAGTRNHWQAFRQGFFTCLLNPKAIGFLLMIYGVIIRPQKLYIGLLFGLQIALTGFLWFCCLTLIINHRRLNQTLKRYQPYIMKVLGLLLILSALSVLGVELHHYI